MKKLFFVLIAVAALGAVTTVSAQATGGGMMGGGAGTGSYGGMMGGGMMGNWDYIPPGSGKPLTLSEATDQAGKYLQAWGNDSLMLSEIMEFSNHFYVEVSEKGTDRKAFELLLNKYTGAVSPEPGPNMMWNLKYGPMVGGMMGGLYQSDRGDKMPITPAKAHELAQKALDSIGTGLKVEDGADQFYGYYTLHTLKDGKTFGMLGVNGFTGQVWLHSWHGKFVDAKEFEAMK